MKVLTVNNLTKNYENFKLDNVSFELEQGKIMGFIGRNGAGKTTTLKSLLNFVHPDGGKISFFEKNFLETEFEIKQRIGFVSGGIDYYANKKIKTITKVTKRLYSHWDDAAYQKYLKLFELDENKTPNKLSAGMKVKYSLTLALSHNAELLILDEPTSGLDPVSRDDLLDIFLSLSDEGITILFSTHITSDLDKCADNITYIKKGKILSTTDIDSFINKYKVLEFSEYQINDTIKSNLIGCKRSKHGYTALVDSSYNIPDNIKCTNADLESVMIHLEKED